MNQENIQSAVYRSLNKIALAGRKSQNSTVDSNKKITSKSNSSAALEQRRVDIQRVRRGSDPGPFSAKEEVKAMASRDATELKLLEVSKGAHNLAQMIDSWSKAQSLDGQSENIARNLHRGALDLQRSLVMLERLQSEPKHMGMVTNKSGWQSPEIGSRRFSISSYQNDMQESRISAGGSSKECSNELKKAIKDHLMRHGPSSIFFDDERASSSRSLNFSPGSAFDEDWHEGKERTVWPSPDTNQAKKPKAPNLIAKLMGLGVGDVPLKGVQLSKMVEDKKKSSKQPEPVLDFEMPTRRRLQLVEQRRDTEKKTLQEIIESIQSKGFVKGGVVEATQTRSPSNCWQMQLFGRNLHEDDDPPPIVIMKPLKLPYTERGEVRKDAFVNKTTVREEIRSAELIKEEKVVNQSRKFSKKLERQGTRRPLTYNEEEKKHVSTMGKELVKSKRPLQDGKKLEVKKDVATTRKTISSARSSTGHARHDQKVLPAKNNHSTKISGKEHNRNSQVKPMSQNSTNLVKEKKTTSAKSIRNFPATKAANGPKKRKDYSKKMSPHKDADNVSATSSTSLADSDADDVSTPGSTSLADRDADSVSIVECTSLADDLSQKTNQDSKSINNEDERKNQEIVSEVTLMSPTTTTVEISPDFAEDNTEFPDKKAYIKIVAEEDNPIKTFLLNTESFLSQAKELLGLDTHQTTHYQRKSAEGIETRDARLFLDCAKELMSCKRHQQELSMHPMGRTNSCNYIVCPSVDQLAEEVSNQIKKLKTCSEIKVNGVAASRDSIYVRLEKDIKCKDILINAVREMDWLNWVCMEDEDQVVGEVENHILSLLIDEIAVDFLY